MKRTMPAAMAALIFLFAGIVYGAAPSVRFVEKLQIPGSTKALVVSEGDFEPRSIGSYTLRIYRATSEKFSTDRFVTGIMRARSGAIEAVKLADLDGDGSPEIVVILRSAGSGGYVSADAFSYRAGLLELFGTVSDLDKTADPVTALRDKYGSPK